ncbi:reverse transcriptase domain-containing protein [Caerostris darwini]|uniref:Reverse transcriptase domain-containing protein n=1 Tax=Caerostris darwini TaxID=1538125 RepID=A0AAV4V824_9ARAC|nr:reverse transcriptase domain-containing protein [Caerostris darwini]
MLKSGPSLGIRTSLIPKEDRNLNHPQDVRPICILPCLGKVFDKFINERLSYILKIKHLLNDLQFGFRKKRSTINALQRIKNFLHNAQEKNPLTCLISIDMADVFNSINLNIM